MSDSSVISSPQKTNTSGGSDTNSAFADAVQRARQLAAKIHSSGSENNSISSGTKRPLEDNMNGSQDGSPDVKKVASSNDPFGAQLAAMQQQRNGPTSDFVIEEFKVPDKMVGLIIGRGGEQIIRLQAESGCKIQLASDSGGLADRPCTLTGSRESVQTVKDMINQIISKANSPFPPGHAPDGQHVAEMMIPGPKVGLLIGKGGENIRNLQEKGGVKMVLIQDGPQQTIHDKPLRITGDPQKVEFAKQMVIDLLAQKELERNLPNGVGAHQEEIMVPRQAVGVIIGKGGDMIKRIQQDSGARVQFIQGKEDIPGDKICQITGSIDQVQKASSQIRDLIQSVLVGFEGMSQESYQTSNHEVRDQQMGGSSNSGSSGGGGRGRGRGRGFGGPGGGGRSDFGPPGPRMGRPQDGMNEIQFAVPANKCGLVIGKGGETVRNINQQSGAHVEIAKGAPPNPHEKIFIIRGNPQQIEHAKQLISERVGGMPPGQSGPPGPNSQGPPGQFQPQYAQQFQQPGPGQAYAPPGWGNTYQHWQNQPAAAGVAVAPNDPAKAAADANAAAWAAYYAQFYNQPAQPQQPQPGQMQPQPQPQQQAQQQLQAQNAGAQPDYSAAWAEYYRSLGMFREAEMIEQQARTNQQGQGGQQPSPAPGAPMAPQPGGAAAPVPQPQQSQPPTQQPPTSAAPTGQAAQPPGAPAAGGPWQPGGYPHQQGQQPPQTQVPYGQPNPYPGYAYAAYGGQQQFPVSAPQ